MTSGRAGDDGWARATALVCGGVVSVAALVVLLAWPLGWERVVGVHPGHPAMPVGTALCLALLGSAVLLAAGGRQTASRRVAAVAAVLPVVALIQLLASGQQGSSTGGALMSPASCAALLALALALVLQPDWAGAAQALALGGTAVGHVAFVGHLYGAEELHGVGDSASVAEHTAALLMVTGVGVVCQRVDVGLPALLAESGVIGSLVRRFAAFAVIVPLLVGALRWAGQQSGWYDTSFGLAIMTVSWTIGLLAVVWWGGRSALPVEQQRDAALARSVAAQDRLGLVADATAAFASTLELDEVLDRVTARMVDTVADGCTVRLTDPTGTLLLPATLYHRDPERRTAFTGLLDRPTSTTVGITGRVIRTRRSVMIEHVSAEMEPAILIPGPVTGFEPASLRSLIVAPLLSGERVLGVIAVTRDQNPVPFDERDLALVEDLAGRASLAIDNAGMVARQHRADVALSEFGRRALVADDPHLLAQHAVELLTETLSARYALLMSVASDGVLSVDALASPMGEQPALGRGSPVTATVPVEVLRTGGSAVCDDLRHDPAPGMVEMGTLLEADSGMAVPVLGDAGTRGVLTVAAVGRGRFGEDDLGFIKALAGLLASALDRLDAQRAVRAVAEERRVLLHRLVTAQEDERARIADGVHEDQVQVITAVDLRLGLLAQRVQQQPELAADVAFARAAVTGAAGRLRDLLFDLQPPDDGVDLAEALRSVAAHLLDGRGIDWCVVSDATGELGEVHRATAYRIAKEAISNVGRHAGAQTVEVRITDADEGLLVTVTDDGVGMHHVPDRSPAGHRGLTSMRDRAAVSGGWLRVESVPDGGTAVRFWVPSGR